MAALPLLPLLGAVVIGRLVMPDDAPRRWMFWVGLGAGLVLAAIWMHDLLQVGYQRYDADGRASFAALLTMVNETARLLADYPWMAALVAGAGCVLDLVCAPVRRWVGRQHVSWMAVRGVVLALAAAVVVQALWSLVGTLPQLDLLTATPLALTDYVRHAVLTLLTSVRLTGFDHLTFVSLWGGFGWLDALLPQPILVAVVTLLLSSVLAMAHAAVTGRERTQQAWLLVFTAGALLSAVTYATAAGLMHRNLHGRYLLPLAVPVTIVIGAWLGSAVEQGREWRQWALASVLVLLHGMSLWWVVARYV